MSQQSVTQSGKGRFFSWFTGKQSSFSMVLRSLCGMERLAERQLLSIASIGVEQGGEGADDTRRLTTLNADSKADRRVTSSRQDASSQTHLLPPSSNRQHVTDSVLALVAQRRPGPSQPPADQAVEQKPAGTTTPSSAPLGNIGWPRVKTIPAATRPRPFFRPRGEPAPPFHLRSSIPLGLYRDGSVRAVHPDIDSDIYRALQRNRLGPWETTLHRSTSPYGAPIRMAAGTEPRLLILAGMQPNWAVASGPLTYTQQSITIASMKARHNSATIYRQLKEFHDFDRNNLAQVQVIRAGTLDPAELQGRHFALFRVRLLLETSAFQSHWALANTTQRLVNSNPVAVELYYHDRLQMVEAVTLGNHMLVGHRRWWVRQIGLHSAQVTSEAWVQPNGKLNEIAMDSLGPLAMERIWTRYLENIGNVTKRPGSRLIIGPVIHQEFPRRPLAAQKSPLPRPWHSWPPLRHQPAPIDFQNKLFTLPTIHNVPRP